MIRYGTFSNFEDIIDLISDKRDDKAVFSTAYGEKYVRINSLRLQCFKRSSVCVECGRRGERFALESSKEGENPHLNFYAIDNDGNEVLMTHDHILPRSKGGKNCIDNVQTMCAICNMKKDNDVKSELLCGLEKKILELISNGMGDRDIFDLVTRSKKIHEELGFNPSGGDFMSVIRKFMMGSRMAYPFALNAYALTSKIPGEVPKFLEKSDTPT